MLQQGMQSIGLRRGKGQKLGQQARREEREFYLFISPWIVGFVLFGAGPIIGSLVLSFTEWSLLAPPKWVGLANFKQLLADQFFRIALFNTVNYGLGSVFLGVIVSFLLRCCSTKRFSAKRCSVRFFTSHQSLAALPWRYCGSIFSTPTSVCSTRRCGRWVCRIRLAGWYRRSGPCQRSS